MRLAVFASGFGSNLEALLRAEKKGRLGPGRIELILSDRPDARALVRANVHRKFTVLLEPEKFKTREDFDRAVSRVLRKKKIGAVVLAGYMRILTPGFVRAYRNRILNIHPALLPSFRGAKAVRDACRHGVKVTGVTVHFVTEDLDDGPVILQEPVKVSEGDSEKTLKARIHAVEHRLYPEAVRLLAEGRLRVRGRKVTIGGRGKG